LHNWARQKTAQRQNYSRIVTSFLDTTREERFFCAALMHVLLTRTASQTRLVQRFADASGTALSAEDLEVYTEIAALRDAWASLGDFKVYADRTHSARLHLLHRLLTEFVGFEGTAEALHELVGRRPEVFLSKKGKIISPGRWPIQQLETLDPLSPDRLRDLRWAFNAKPDLLLLSGGQGVLIEAKAASGFGSNSATGYSQAHILEVVAQLFPIVVPEVVAKPLAMVYVTNQTAGGGNHLHWSELREACDRTDVRDFAIRALDRAAHVLA
jgi:hypothetical protein